MVNPPKSVLRKELAEFMEICRNYQYDYAVNSQKCVWVPFEAYTVSNRIIDHFVSECCGETGYFTEAQFWEIESRNFQLYPVSKRCDGCGGKTYYEPEDLIPIPAHQWHDEITPLIAENFDIVCKCFKAPYYDKNQEKFFCPICSQEKMVKPNASE